MAALPPITPSKLVTPKPLLIAAGLASLAALASGPVGAVMAIRGEQWLAVGFDAVVCLAGALGVLIGLGKFRESHPLAMLCVGGAIGAAGALAFLASGRAPAGSSSLGVFLPALVRDPLTAARVVPGAGLVFLAGLTLVLRRPGRSMRLLGLGLALGAPVVAAAAAWLTPSVRAQIMDLPALALATLVFAGFFVLGGLLSVSLHCLIRAIEVGWADGDPQEFRARQKSL